MNPLIALRRSLISRPLRKWTRRVLPAMSDTEREAIEAGTVWWDAELFSGKPDWRVLHAQPKAVLSGEEQAFLDGPVEALCHMIDDWQVNFELRNLPPEVWAFIGENGFFGMIIPKAYGGLGFQRWPIRRWSARSRPAASLPRLRSWFPTRSARPNCCCITGPRIKRTIIYRAWLSAMKSRVLR